STSIKSGAILQIAAAAQSAGVEGERAQIAGDQTSAAEAVDRDQSRTGQAESCIGAGQSAATIGKVDGVGKRRQRQCESHNHHPKYPLHDYVLLNLFVLILRVCGGFFRTS